MYLMARLLILWAVYTYRTFTVKVPSVADVWCTLLLCWEGGWEAQRDGARGTHAADQNLRLDISGLKRFLW